MDNAHLPIDLPARRPAGPETTARPTGNILEHDQKQHYVQKSHVGQLLLIYTRMSGKPLLDMFFRLNVPMTDLPTGNETHTLTAGKTHCSTSGNIDRTHIVRATWELR